MLVNNLTCKTLDLDNLIAKLYTQKNTKIDKIKLVNFIKSNNKKT
jgi:hypothetical protein